MHSIIFFYKSGFSPALRMVARKGLIGQLLASNSRVFENAFGF